MRKMKVVWFVNSLMPEVCRHIGRPVPLGSGGWISSLLARIKQRPDVELAVVASGGRKDYRFTAEGVQYFVLKVPTVRLIKNRLLGFRIDPPSDSQLRQFASVVRELNPDLVHVHGTELGFGVIKARGMTDKPLAVSIQGLMSAYAAKAYGDLLPNQIHGANWRLAGPRPACYRRWRSFLERVPGEEETLKSADMVIGRTDWDRAWSRAYRADVRYRHVDEIFRPEFYEAAAWSQAGAQPHRIFCASQAEPLKGVHVLIEAVHFLRQRYPDLQLRVAGAGFSRNSGDEYMRYLVRLIAKWKLDDVVTFLGLVEPSTVVNELQQAHCNVTPSFVENSSNALQEAMLVGTPCVASHTGGTPTMIEAEKTGLTFPTGDAASLAEQVDRLLRDAALAETLSRSARLATAYRNAPERIEAQLLAAYYELAGKPASKLTNSSECVSRTSSGE